MFSKIYIFCSEVPPPVVFIMSLQIWINHLIKNCWRGKCNRGYIPALPFPACESWRYDFLDRGTRQCTTSRLPHHIAAPNSNSPANIWSPVEVSISLTSTENTLDDIFVEILNCKQEVTLRNGNVKGVRAAHWLHTADQIPIWKII